MMERGVLILIVFDMGLARYLGLRLRESAQGRRWHFWESCTGLCLVEYFCIIMLNMLHFSIGRYITVNNAHDACDKNKM